MPHHRQPLSWRAARILIVILLPCCPIVRIGEPNEAGALIRLSTGCGGGKTHTLIALWHLARNISDTALGTELVSAAGRPAKVAVAGVDGDKTGSDVCLRHGDIVTHSLWGELAYQLGGPANYAKVKDIDDPEKVPDAALIREILPGDTPVLILLDEIVLYMLKLTAGGSSYLSPHYGYLVLLPVFRLDG